jgi:hypothetical protein
MRSLWTFSAGLIGLVGSATTLVMAYSYWSPKASRDAKPAVIFLSLYVLVLMIVLIWREVVYSRKARYAEVLTTLNHTFRMLQQLACNDVTSVDEIKSGCARITTHTAHALAVTTGTKCSVCIKVLEDDLSDENRSKARPEVRTLCRDDGSERQRKLSDAAGTHHWIDQNTDFYELHKNAGKLGGGSFFSNNLPGYNGYVNSSYEIYGKPNQSTFLTNLFPSLFWTLPYKSSVVIPISVSEPGAREDVPQSVVGYLCVDSKSRGAFSKRYDPELLAGLGECLYPILNRYCDLKFTAQRRAYED